MWCSALLILWWERYYTEREKVKFGNMSRSQECKLVFIWIQITWFSTGLEDLFTENKLKFSTLTESYFQIQYFFVGWRTKIIIWIYITAFLGKTAEPKSGYLKQKGNLMERLRSRGTTASLENQIWKIRSPGFLWGIRNPHPGCGAPSSQPQTTTTATQMNALIRISRFLEHFLEVESSRCA